MNRFKIIKGREKDFERIWRERDTHLDEVEGFETFSLVRGDSEESYTLYASHTIWKSRQCFVAWTKSEEFRRAHKNAGNHNDIYLGHPEFEGFEKVI